MIPSYNWKISLLWAVAQHRGITDGKLKSGPELRSFPELISRLKKPLTVFVAYNNSKRTNLIQLINYLKNTSVLPVPCRLDRGVRREEE